MACTASAYGEAGTLELHNQCAAALGSGKVECVVTLDGDGSEPKQHPSGKEWDLWLNMIGKSRFLVPQNGARFAVVGVSEIGKAACQAADYKRGRLRLDLLFVGARVCVLTGHGRYADLTVESSGRTKMDSSRFSYVLWE
jgi:hypothetical protein